MIANLLILSLLGSCVAWPLGRRLDHRRAGWILAILPAALFTRFLSFAPAIAAGQVVTDRVAWAPSLGVDVTLRLDGFAFLFCLLITGIGALVVIYAGAYFAERPAADRTRFHTLILFFMTAMLGAVLADNLLVLFLFWEATSLISFLLIGFDVESPSARRSALMSLRVTAGGGLALLASILCIGVTLGTYSMSEVIARAPEIAQSRWVWLILGGICIGAFTKSAQFPFHFWLPNAMQAPTPASAYLHSATMVKLGIYLLARFEQVIGAVPGGRDILIIVALATMLTGAYQAMRAENYKAVLAYSTVASLGILTMLVGLDGPMASVATVGFLLAHALYKATLFFCAGTVIHATGISRLRHLGGLGRFLPVTAAASALASLSMAGLPPFLGFVTKEFLFEAQIESSWDVIPMAIAVLVNAVIVGVAGIVTLRPFFMGQGRVRSVKHREVAGLLVGPVILALLGLVVSLEPEPVSGTVLRPAVASIYGRPVEVNVGLWHGVTPMLLLSAVVIATGALIFIYWVPLHRRLRRQSAMDRYEAEHAYDALLRRIEGTAMRVVRWMRRRDLRADLLTIFTSVGLFLLWGVFATRAMPRLPAGGGALRIGVSLIALLGLVGGIAAARARSLVAAMIASGLAGLVTALIFLMDGAPDLALTQFAVESLVVVLLTAALLALPLSTPPTRTPGAQRRDALLAAALAGLLFIALLDMSAAPQQTEISAFYGARSYMEAFGRNVVNVILVDFRGFDTLGETTVIALAGIIAWSLLGRRLQGERPTAPRAGRIPFILRFTSPLFFWLLLVLSVFELLRGHNAVGGGFVGGLMAALAFAIVGLAKGIGAAKQRLRWSPMVVGGAGLLLAVASGFPGLVAHGEYLRHVWVQVDVFGIAIKQGTTLLFDMGVYLAVLGTVLAFFFGFSREAER